MHFSAKLLSRLSICISLILCFSNSKATAQTYEFLNVYSAEDVSNLAISFGISPAVYSAEYGVEAFKVNYEMPYLGETIEVSGAMFIPTAYPAECGLPVHTYMHGTIFKRSDAPSNMTFEAMLGFLMSSPGYIVIMPDYVGLGDSQLMHPYVHAQSESDAGIYMMQAIETFGDELGFSLTDQIFISGYSQGGHAAMAMAKDIQENYAGTYEVTACAPMSGPYDISGTQIPITLENDEYSNPAYLAYNVIGWNSFYGNLYDDLSEIFQEPYASILPDLFDGETSGGEINDQLPSAVTDLVQPGILDEILNNPDHPFMIAAQDNDVHEWAPEFDLQMYYCTEDEQVFYQNAISAFDYMSSTGAENVSAFNGGAYDHNECAGPSILSGLLWMDQRLDSCDPESVDDIEAAWSIYPNPTSGEFFIQGALGSSYRVRDLSGRIIASGLCSSTNQALSLNSVSGIYFVEIDGLGTQKLLKQ